MPKGIYWGGGTSRKVKRVYLGIDGVSHNVKKGYIGDETGKARLFYSNTYVWNKYEVQQKTYYKERTFQFDYDDIHIYGLDPGDIKCLTDGVVGDDGYYTAVSGHFFVNNGQITRGIKLMFTRYRNAQSGDGDNYVYVYALQKDTAGNPFDRYKSKYYLICDVKSAQGIISYSRAYEIVDDYTEEIAGNYIGTVTAEDENLYPSNGKHTDGYWYVLQT